MLPPTRPRWVTFDCYGTLVDRTSRPAARPHPDVEPVLAELRRRGYRLGVLTNCDDALFERTHRTFHQPFDLFVTSERIRAYKPELWHFRAFKRLARVCKDDWVHVSSDWRTDLAPARAFGIPRVWWNRDRSSEDPGPAIARAHSADELVATVDWLLQERVVRAS